MKNYLKLFAVLSVFFLTITSCSPDKIEEPEVYNVKGNNSKGNEVLIQDENFKNTLINTNCVDTNGDGTPDRDIDLNNDGKIEKKELNSVESLILEFDYGTPIKFVELEGIENFVNLKSLKISGTGGSIFIDEVLNTENLNYDFTGLRKLEYLQINHLATEYFDTINLSGLTKLVKIDLSGNRPMDYYSEKDKFITIDMEGCSALKDLNITNSFLNIDYCQVPSLERLNVMYLEGGEPEVFDFHCLSNLKWLNITENMINTLILKNSSVLDTLVIDYPYGNMDWYYPFPKQICIDDFPEERQQIIPLIGENTIVTTSCTF